MNDCIAPVEAGRVEPAGSRIPAHFAVSGGSPHHLDNLMAAGSQNGAECASDQAACTSDRDTQRSRGLLSAESVDGNLLNHPMGSMRMPVLGIRYEADDDVLALLEGHAE